MILLNLNDKNRIQLFIELGIYFLWDTQRHWTPLENKGGAVQSSVMSSILLEEQQNSVIIGDQGKEKKHP